MLDIIFTIFVVIWFAKTAKELGRSRFIWGVIGGASFLGTELGFSIFVWPEVAAFFPPRSNEALIYLLGGIVGVVLGAACCFIASLRLEGLGRAAGHNKKLQPTADAPVE